jgi:tripartite-type tricarboxylate transporter receptor subunit TctC
MSNRRRVLGAMVTGAAALMVHAAAAAQAGRVLRIVVPYAAGGGADILARHLAESLATELGINVIVENRAGGSGNIGAMAVARAPADGTTLLMGDLALAVNQSLFKKLGYDPVADFQPVAQVAAAPLVLVVNPSVPATTVAELVALARQKPGGLTYASAGNGNPPHIAAELFRTTTGIDVAHVPYKGVGPALNDLLGGQVTMLFTGISSTRQHIESGKLGALAVTGKRRAATLPEVPTMAEAGLPTVEVTSWWGLFAPAGLDAELASTFARAAEKALQSPAMKQRLGALNIDAAYAGADVLKSLLVTETARWAKVIRAASISAE